MPTRIWTITAGTRAGYRVDLGGLFVGREPEFLGGGNTLEDACKIVLDTSDDDEAPKQSNHTAYAVVDALQRLAGGTLQHYNQSRLLASIVELTGCSTREAKDFCGKASDMSSAETFNTRTGRWMPSGRRFMHED